MLRNVIAIGLTILAALAALSCRSQRVNEDEIRTYIDDYAKRAEYLNRRIALARWQYLTAGRADSLPYFLRLNEELNSNPAMPLFVKEYLAAAEDDNDRRRLEFIHRAFLRTVVESDSSVRQVRDLVLSAAVRWKPQFQGVTAAEDSLRRIIVSESDRRLRQDAYTALTALGDSLAPGVVRLVRLRNQVAAAAGYPSYYDMMLTVSGLDKGEYLALLNDICQSSESSYRRAVDSVMRQLSLPDLQAWDIEYALHQTSVPVEPYYAAVNQTALLRFTLRGLGINVDSLPIYFAPAITVGAALPNDVMMVQVPRDIRVVTAASDGPASLSRLFGQVGRALYAVNIGQPDYLLAQPPAPCFAEGMAQIAREVIDLDSWRRKYAAMPEPLVIELAAIRDFSRLYDLRFLLVQIAFEQELYQNPLGDLDLRYRQLFEKYMMFPCRGAKAAWAAQIDFVTDPVSLQNRLVGRCIAAQTLAHLCEEYGAILDNSHLQDFLMRNYYRHGGSEDWRTLVTRGTGEKLNPKYLFRQCAN